MSEKRVAFYCYNQAAAYTGSSLAAPYIGTFHVLSPSACTASPISLSPFCVCCASLYEGEERFMKNNLWKYNTHKSSLDFLLSLDLTDGLSLPPAKQLSFLYTLSNFLFLPMQPLTKPAVLLLLMLLLT